METNETDKNFQDFFKLHKHDIPDNGFTNRTLQYLPRRKDYSWIVWLLTTIGIATALYIGIFSDWLMNFIEHMFNLPFIYLLIGVALFPLVIGLCIMFWEKEQY
ncbi:MAG TPA: DUF5056 domain-containing protein [Paludibacteraceae bacterium]|nr:DUF5056 domain-containing protein [Paludibacteraceae bacterium]